MHRIALAGLAIISSTGTAQAATTIGFQPLELASSVPVTYTEAGYTLQSNNTRVNAVGTTINTTLTVQKFIGSAGTGIPSVNFARSTSFSLTGGTFTFDGLSAYFSGTTIFNTFDVKGFLLDKELYSKTFTSTDGTSQSISSFRDIASGSAAIFDKLVFTSGSVAGQIILDDVKVSAATIPNPPPISTPEPTSAVPEPATWAMMIVGFGLVGGTMRRRKQHVAVRFA